MAKRKKTAKRRAKTPAPASGAAGAAPPPAPIALGPPRAVPFAGKPRARVGQTLRLDPTTWLALKKLAAELAVERGRQVSAHELIVEAVEDLIARLAREVRGEMGKD